MARQEFKICLEAKEYTRHLWQVCASRCIYVHMHKGLCRSTFVGSATLFPDCLFVLLYM